MTTPKNSNDDARGSKSSGSKKKSGSKKNGSTKGGILSTSNHNDESNEPVPLIRVSASNQPHSINPRGILTGFYSKNGKRMQHIVHCGALQMPKESADVIEKFTKLTGMEPVSKYNLPGLDSVLRPCIDPKMKNITVTELMIEKVNTPQQVEPPKLTPEQVAGGMVPEAPKIIIVKTSRSAAKNRLIRRVPTNKAVLKSNMLGAERIRGGGDGDFGTASEGQQQQQQQQQSDQVQVVNMDIDETSEPIAGIETTQSAATTGGQITSTSNVTENTNVNLSSTTTSTTQDQSATAEASSIDTTTNDIPKSSGEEAVIAALQVQPSNAHSDQMPTSSSDTSPVDMDTTPAAALTSTESGQLSINTIENESAIADESLKVPVAASTVTVDKAVESGNDITKNDRITNDAMLLSTETSSGVAAAQEQANPQSASTAMITGEYNMAVENNTFATAASVTSMPTTSFIPGTTTAAISTNAPSAGKDISSLQASITTMNTDESKKDVKNNTAAAATLVTSTPTANITAATTTAAISTPSAGKDISSLQASITTMNTDESKKDAKNNTAAAATSVTSTPTANITAATTTAAISTTSAGKDISSLRASNTTMNTDESKKDAKNNTAAAATSVTSTPTTSITAATTTAAIRTPSAGKDISSLRASNTTMKTYESKKDAENGTVVTGASTTPTASTVAVTNTGTNAPSAGKDLSSLRASNTNNIAASVTSTLNTTSTSTVAVTTTAPSAGKDISSLRASTSIPKADDSNKVTENDTYESAASITSTLNTTSTSTSTIAGTSIAGNAPSGGKDISSLRAFTTTIAKEKESNNFAGNIISMADASSTSTPNTTSTVAGTTTTINAPTGGKDISALRASASIASIDKIPSSTLSSDAIGATDAPKSTSVAPVATKPIKTEEKKAAPEVLVPQVKSLTSKPAPQWEQHRPTPNDETITTADQLPPKPEWYKRDGIDEIERTMLPEWFNSSAPHRTPETFLKSREKIIEMSEALANRNVTNAMIRRTVLGDAGSLHRLRSFLVRWGVINKDGINDSAPTPASLRPDLKRSAVFNDDIKDDLIVAVTQQAKKRKLEKAHNDDANVVPSSISSFDWEEVAALVGHGVSAEDCQRNFMMTPLSKESSSTSNVTQEIDGVASAKIEPNQSKGASQKEFIRNLVQSSDPEVRRKMFDAAMEATCGDVVESQAASLLGLHTTKALEDSRGHEIDLAVRLSKLMDARMQKLENRMAMMDDVEAILEAEKMALEMERRDLYTARCRHWFGGV
jgi:hypothetical protein